MRRKMEGRYGKEGGINGFEISDIRLILEKDENFNNGHVDCKIQIQIWVQIACKMTGFMLMLCLRGCYAEVGMGIMYVLS